ncbi:hypothetical protein BO86DRAFT_306603, partial [Aspergillus japonicus CBS 114.51]
SWKVSVATAKVEMEKAGISHQGKTGYPHPYHNHQKLNWSVATCKKANIDLLEYPVFWERHASIYNTKKTNQQAHSPIRVVYANDGGVMVYCGVMTHVEAEQLEDMGGQGSWTGKEGFRICT